MHLGGKRRALLLEVGNEVTERGRIEHGTGEHVRASLASLLENRDGERLTALLLLELRKTEGGGKSRGAAAYDQDVYV